MSGNSRNLINEEFIKKRSSLSRCAKCEATVKEKPLHRINPKGEKTVFWCEDCYNGFLEKQGKPVDYDKIIDNDYDFVLKKICDIQNVGYFEVKGKSRKRELVEVRRIFAYIVTNIKSPDYFKNGRLNEDCRIIIAKHIKRDKHGVNVLLKRAKDYMSYDKLYDKKVKKIEGKVLDLLIDRYKIGTKE